MAGAGWNETLSNQLKALKAKKNPTAADKAKITELQAIKAGTNSTSTTSNTADNTASGNAANIDSGGVTTLTDAQAIERARQIINAGEQYGRGIANEFYAPGSLGRMSETLTPDEQAALDRAREFVATAGVQSDAVKNLIAQQQGILTNAQQLSPLELEALQVARSSLGGLAAPEMEGLRSQARQNIQGQMQAGIRDLAKSQARNQVFGSAATAQRNLMQQAGVREGRNLERDLLVKNIEIKQAAQNAFTGLTTNTEANRASRTNAASGQLSNTMLSDESTRLSAQNAANANYGGIASNTGNSLRSTQEFNLGQAAAEKAGQVGSIFGGIGTLTGQRGLLAGENFAGQQFDLSKITGEQLLEMFKRTMKEQGY